MKTLIYSLMLMVSGMLMLVDAAPAQAQEQARPKVFMTKDISPAGLQKIYAALGRPVTGKVGVKLSFGEPGGTITWPRI